VKHQYGQSVFAVIRQRIGTHRPPTSWQPLSYSANRQQADVKKLRSSATETKNNYTTAQVRMKWKQLMASLSNPCH